LDAGFSADFAEDRVGDAFAGFHRAAGDRPVVVVGAGYSSFQCSINGGSFTACTSGSAITSQADGFRTFAVRAVDGSSVATTSASYAWTINTVAPSVTPVAGISGGGTYAAISEAFTCSHLSYSTFQCYLDAPTTFVGCANGKTFSGLADGSHTVTSSALDADNVATGNGTFSWTVKHAAPTLTAKPASQTNSTTATFNFNETPYSTGTSFDQREQRRVERV
jgi:hypothetical protein